MCTGPTQLYLLVEYEVHKVQQHVSALDIGHLQVVHETLLRNYTKYTWAVFIG